MIQMAQMTLFLNNYIKFDLINIVYAKKRNVCSNFFPAQEIFYSVVSILMKKQQNYLFFFLLSIKKTKRTKRREKKTKKIINPALIFYTLNT